MKRQHDDLEDVSQTQHDMHDYSTANRKLIGVSSIHHSKFNHPYWLDLLETLRASNEADAIRECDGIDVRDIVEKAEEYFQIASQRLRVFPFKNVGLCWHRLYTDTSIVRAINAIVKHVPLEPSDKSVFLDEIIGILDMAMITTGGLGREEMLVGIWQEVEVMVHASRQQENQLLKRAKVQDLLPTTEHSVPVLKFCIPTRLYAPSMTVFQNHIHHSREPVLLLGILKDWPALEKWQSLTYWMQTTLEGHRLVPVEIGRSYVDEDWSQRIIPFREFLHRYITAEDGERGYLAQHDLFSQIPKVGLDIATPDYCFLDAPAPEPEMPVAKAKLKNGMKTAELVDDEVHRNIWFGPAWTISPLHHDPYHNILCQVIGKKYIRLYSPQYSQHLYPCAEDEPAPHGEGVIDMSNTSSVDVAAMELSPDEDWNEKWPGIREIPYQEVVLKAGEALYIPIGWWHYVRSCSVGISVSFWWS